MKIDWKAKLSSRKFWAAVASFVTSLLAAFGVAESEITQIVGVITAFGTVAIYMISEAVVDVARSNNTENEESEETENDNSNS